MNKYVIEANKNTGKTTLVKKLLKVSNRKTSGFFTIRVPELCDQDGLCPIYICPINEELKVEEKYYLGKCGKGKHISNDELFNTLGVELITTNDPSELIIIDEIGFLETNAEKYKNKVFDILASNNPVLLMIKSKPGVEFLDKIRSLSNINYIKMNENNRNDIFEKLKNELFG